jgi:hypothetical protein
LWLNSYFTDGNSRVDGGIFTLDLKFSDGSVKRFDVEPYLKYAVFTELIDVNYFKTVRLTFGTIQWPNEQDAKVQSAINSCDIDETRIAHSTLS